MAYPFWVRVNARMVELGLLQTEFAERSGIPSQTMNRLKTLRRKPRVGTVHALADAAGIPRDEAEQLAGLVPTPATGGSADVRAAVIASAAYTEDQRVMLLQLIDLLDRVNGQSDMDRATG